MYPAHVHTMCMHPAMTEPRISGRLTFRSMAPIETQQCFRLVRRIVWSHQRFCSAAYFACARHACTICICVAWCVEGARSGHACAYVSMHVCAVSQAQVRCAQLEGGQAGGHSRLLCRKPHAFFNVKKAPQNIPNLQEQYSMCSVAFGSQSG